MSKRKTRTKQIKITKPLSIGYERSCNCEPNHINCTTAKEWIQAQVAVWEFYYENRLQAKLVATLLGRNTLQKLCQRQGGRCDHCGERFRDPSEWHLHHRHWRVYGGNDALYNLQLLHANCHRQVHSQGLESELSCVPRGAFDEGLSCVSGN